MSTVVKYLRFQRSESECTQSNEMNCKSEEFVLIEYVNQSSMWQFSVVV